MFDLCFHTSCLPCLDTFWHAIPTSFYIFKCSCININWGYFPCNWLKGRLAVFHLNSLLNPDVKIKPPMSPRNALAIDVN